MKSVLECVEGRSFHAHVKALCTSSASFGIEFHALDATVPAFDVVIDIDEFYADLVTPFLVFIFTNFIFFARVNVWIVEEYNNLLEERR